MQDKILIFSRHILPLAHTETVDGVEGALSLASQTPNILCYLPPGNSGKIASRFASLTSEEIMQINFFVVYITSLF